MVGLPLVTCKILLAGSEVFSETFGQCRLRHHEHVRASRQGVGHDGAGGEPRCVAMWRVSTVLSLRLPQTCWFELGSCDKSGTFFSDSYLKKRHGNFRELFHFY